MNDPTQPQGNDAVLGGQAPPTGAVLGGLAAIRQRLSRDAVEQQIAALTEALSYGRSGLELVIQVLLESEFPNSGQLQTEAFRLLHDRSEPSVKTALRTYNPYAFFQCLATYGHHDTSMVRSVILSPDGQTLMSRGDRTVEARNLKTGRMIATLNLPLGSGAMCDAIADFYPHLRIWGMQNGQIERHAIPGESHLAFFPDGQTIATCGTDQVVRLWNRHTGELVGSLLKHSIQVNAVVVSPDGQTLVSGGNDGLIVIWDVPTQREVMTLEQKARSIGTIAMTTEGETLVSTGSDRVIRVWNLKTGQEMRTLTGHTDTIPTIAISTDGKTLISGSADKTIKVWNLQTGQELQTFTGHSHYILSVAISQDKQRIVSGSRDGTIKVWGLPSVE